MPFAVTPASCLNNSDSAENVAETERVAVRKETSDAEAAVTAVPGNAAGIASTAAAPALRQHALGEPAPDSPHAVVVNLPALADVIGYEERDAATMAAIRTGYPRFLRHPFVAEAACKLAAHAGVDAAACEILPVASPAAARRLIATLALGDAASVVAETDFSRPRGAVATDDAVRAGDTGEPPVPLRAATATAPAAADPSGGWALLCVRKDAGDAAARAAKYVQHTGLQISSRRAEDWLARLDGKTSETSEPREVLDGDPATAVARLRERLAPWLEPTTAAPVPATAAAAAADVSDDAVRAGNTGEPPVPLHAAAAHAHATAAATANASDNAARAGNTGEPPVPLHAAALEPAAADIHVFPNGMNALWAGIEAVRAVQRAAGRGVWLQLGWLYADTADLLQKSLRPGEQLEVIHDVLDKAAIEAFFARHGGAIAGVVAETPTNPLLRTPDLDHLRALADRHGALLLLDPSAAGIVHTRALPHADLLAVSLTKYAAHEGDVLLGALAIHPCRHAAAALRAALRVGGHVGDRDESSANDFNAAVSPSLTSASAAENTGEPPVPLHAAAFAHGHAAALAPAYWRDAARLAFEMREMETVAARAAANTARLAAWLGAHPAVRRVLWTGSAGTAANYARIARSPAAHGCLLSLELHGGFAAFRDFHDRVRAVKGPSFGTRFTIVSPYIYMAHYDLVRDAACHSRMRALGVPPTLLRVSVGAEPFEEIRSAFAEALAAVP